MLEGSFSEAKPTQRPLQRTGFLLFWAGETVSMFGTQITMLALPLTAVLVLHATPPQLGFVRFVEQFPYVLFTLLFGAWADRRRRKPILIMTNAARGLLIGLVPLLAILGLLQLPLLGTIAFAVGAFTVLFDVTWLAYVPTLIEPDELLAANGRVLTSSAAAEVAGPGLAGILVQLLTAPLALVTDAVSYVAAAISLLLIRTPEPVQRSATGQRPDLLREIGEGFQVLLRNRYLRAITVMSGLWNFLFSVADTVFLLYAVRELSLQPGTLGIIFAVGAVGGLVGSAISTHLGKRGTFGPVLGVAFIFGCLPWLLLPAVSGSQPIEIAAFTLAYFLVRLGLGLWGVLTLSLRQAITPLHLMSRVSASMRLVSYGLGALGFLLSGILGTLVGLRATLWLTAFGFVAILIITLAATPLPSVRAIPGAEEMSHPDAVKETPATP
ncbi:MAG TPA: MFS transporter [Ktedonobacterales bacterium]|jgi:MFS family permease|nr:MFS transporter [Ktedonobacterales bacterium]